MLAFAFPTLVLSYNQDAKDVWINNLALCETGNRDVTILDTNKKYSYGYLQFQMGTWLAYGKSLGATSANIHDYALQHQVARTMLNAGLQNQWKTCAEKVTRKYGSYPTWVDSMP